MMERHRERVAVADALYARAIGAQHRVVDVLGFPLHPVEQRRAEVEAEKLVYGGQGAVRFVCDPDVPVVLGRRGWLRVNLACPGILPRWLVEVSVNDDESVHLMTSAMLRRTFGKMLSCAPSASTRCI